MGLRTQIRTFMMVGTKIYIRNSILKLFLGNEHRVTATIAIQKTAKQILSTYLAGVTMFCTDACHTLKILLAYDRFMCIGDDHPPFLRNLGDKGTVLLSRIP